jgi:hypothetical protein
MKFPIDSLSLASPFSMSSQLSRKMLAVSWTLLSCLSSRCLSLWMVLSPNLVHILL